MKKFLIFIIAVTTVVLLSWMISEYSKQEISMKCMKTTKEKLIGDCLEYNGFDNRREVVESAQIKYNFHYLNSLYKFKDAHIQENFVISYGAALSECQHVEGCETKDEGRGYYIAMNNCLMNGKCINNFIYLDNQDCKSLFDLQIEKIPKHLQNLITADKIQVCKIKTKSLELKKRRGF